MFRLFCCCLSAGLATLASHANAQISAPILPGVTVGVQDVVSFPDTRGIAQEDNRSAANVARINFMREIPGYSDQWLVNDLRGPIYRVEPASQQVVEYLDVADVFSRFNIGPGGLSTGLNTVALHPEFAVNGKFYTIHSESAAGNPGAIDFGNLSPSLGHTVVVEWTADNPSAGTFSGTHRELLRVGQGSRIHNLGDISFNPMATPGDPDYGMMYIAGGDSNTGSPAQDLGSIFGKLLRIDPAGNNSANGAYGVPADNPFASDGDPNTLAEVWAYGFRNLHRISWDQQTGAFLGTDIGDGSVEEVNFLAAGSNYGWSTFEGTFFRGGGAIPRGTDTDSFVWPAAQYDHGDGLAIAGGFVYRGAEVPELYGKFVYGDIVNGRLFYSDFDELVAAHEDGDFRSTADVHELFLTQGGQAVTVKDLIIDARTDASLPNNRTDLRFGQDSAGEIYLSTKQDGWIRTLTGDRTAVDYNGDGLVDAADYTVWRDAVATNDLTADGNNDGVVDALDYAVWRRNFGFTYVAPGGAVPESGAMLLACWVLAGSLAASHLRRSREWAPRESVVDAIDVAVC
ncbi:Soluble aldose sugar dehydrogenase YliI precursor [Posidoniimonas polymericola]|uniref:Soluble aldose sugar dehydrogenase YliI n=1 Tax=Posidoniimonas polymericola TaxID=2528002 RepID=A0A5C5YEZ7_9BACT|nr:PQQ-dependent sugar dehydrogenase [Posidoniimonas polymericola]TWT73578.1 Soluble aldose sugar dehydrogenase YliI precursor [Posidoniimonas polymericola]